MPPPTPFWFSSLTPRRFAILSEPRLFLTDVSGVTPMAAAADAAATLRPACCMRVPGPPHVAGQFDGCKQGSVLPSVPCRASPINHPHVAKV